MIRLCTFLSWQVGRGLQAIIEEIEQNGSEEGRECRDYVLYEEAGSSNKTFQNGWKRDCDKVTGEVLESRQVADAEAPGGKRGMFFRDFCEHPIAKFCGLTDAEVFVLRYYTTAGFKGINWPLRDKGRRERAEPHLLAVLVFTLTTAIKKLRAWAANDANAQTPVDLFRGMSNREIFDTFMEKGGTELAPMSSTAELEVLSICLHVYMLTHMRTPERVRTGTRVRACTHTHTHTHSTKQFHVTTSDN